MSNPASYLAAYDQHYRTARTQAALSVTRLGPLHLIAFDRGHGFVTYQHLGGMTAAEIRRMVPAALDHFRADPTIERVDWKTCSHDHAPGLVEALLSNGFTRGAKESIMVGASRALAIDVELPAGLALRTITTEDEVAAMEQMQGEVFGDPDWPRRVPVMMRRLESGDGMQMWIAESAGIVVSAGRIEPVEGTDFADLCGGATRVEWRGRGIYRAVTSARARAAVGLGKSLLHSSSTKFSRPLLERSGLVRVSTNTSYCWRPPRTLLSG